MRYIATGVITPGIVDSNFDIPTVTNVLKYKHKECLESDLTQDVYSSHS